MVTAAFPWLRTLIAIPLCVIAFNATHSLGAALSSSAYGDLNSDSQRLALLAFITLADVAATFVMVAVARHRA